MTVCQVTGFYICISTRKKKIWYIHHQWFYMYSMMGSFSLQCIPSCIDVCGCGRLSCTLRQNAFVEKQLLATEHTTDWFIEFYALVFAHACVCVSLVHYASLWSVMSGCHCFLLIMDDCYDARTHIHMYWAHTQMHVSDINFMNKLKYAQVWM